VRPDVLQEWALLMIDHPLHVIVKFGDEVPGDVQGPALLDLERNLRRLTGKWVEVFKDIKGDDSKLRSSMTPDQRARL
jgi:hypothetical protein